MCQADSNSRIGRRGSGASRAGVRDATTSGRTPRPTSRSAVRGQVGDDLQRCLPSATSSSSYSSCTRARNTSQTGRSWNGTADPMRASSLSPTVGTSREGSPTPAPLRSGASGSRSPGSSRPSAWTALARGGSTFRSGSGLGPWFAPEHQSARVRGPVHVHKLPSVERQTETPGPGIRGRVWVEARRRVHWRRRRAPQSNPSAVISGECTTMRPTARSASSRADPTGSAKSHSPGPSSSSTGGGWRPASVEALGPRSPPRASCDPCGP